MEHLLYAGKGQTLDTPAKALIAAKAFAPQAVTIILSGGRYPLNVPLAITQSNLTLCARAGEEVVFTGSLPLVQPNWQPTAQNPNLYATPLPTDLAVDGFFVDDAPQILARYPNYTEGVLPLGGVLDAAAMKARSTRWQNPSTGYLRALHDMGWGGNDYQILGKDATAETGLALAWVGDNNRGAAYKPDALMVEGVLEELDAPGEYYYDASAGLLYFYPPDGMDLTAPHQFEVAVCSELMTICGEGVNAPIENIRIEGITLQNTKRSLFEGKPYLPLLRGDWAVVPQGAITLTNAKQVSITHCTFQQIGGNAIFCYGYHQDHAITHNRFCHLGACGIQLVGKASAVDDASFWPHQHYPALQVHATTVKHPAHIGPISEEYPRDITIAENVLYDIGVYEKQSCGVNLSVASRIKILHNTIYKSARSNLNINDGSFGGHEIAYNDIFDAQRETTDHGPFNSWGRDRFWSVPRQNAIGEGGEVIRHYPHTDGSAYDTALLDAYQTTSIHHNRFHHAKDAPHTWGIDLDDGSSNYEIHHNLCLGLGIKLREGFARRVHHNVLLEGKLEIHVSYTEAQDEIYGNLVVNHQPWNFIGVDAARFAAAQYRVDGNWYHNLGQPIILPSWFAPAPVDGADTPAQGEGAVAADAHCANATCNTPQSERLPDANALFGVDPLFADPAANDYTPTNTAALAALGFSGFAAQYGAALAQDLPDATPPHYPLTAGDSKAPPIYLWHRASLSDITDAIISATASAGFAGCYVIETGRGDAAALGLRGHDVIKAINGEAVADTPAFLAKMNALEAAGETITLTLHREGGQMALTLQG